MLTTLRAVAVGTATGILCLIALCRVHPGTHPSPIFRGVMVDADKITPSDILVLKQWHVNLVRWGLHRTDKADLATYDASLEGKLARLDQILPFLKEAGILVVLDLHDIPGGRDSQGRCRLFTDRTIQQHFCELWERMARRYRNQNQIWAYDLMNEPVQGVKTDGVPDWHELADEAAMRVRRIDPRHPIIVEPAPWAFPEALAQFPPLKTSGIIYSVHMYDPHAYTHQGVDSDRHDLAYPGVIDGVQWDKARIEKDFAPVVDYARRNHARIYVGEFSAIRWAKGATQYLSDVIDVMEQNRFDWSYHAFREWSGWDPEVTDDPTSTEVTAQPTDRLRRLKSAFAANAP